MPFRLHFTDESEVLINTWQYVLIETGRWLVDQGESDGDGVRQTRRTGYGEVGRGSGEIGTFKTQFPRFERNDLGSRKEHFGEATVRELGNIFE